MASSDPKGALLSTQTEKPNHYTYGFRCRYLKEFRVEQCPSFLQHKCNQHRPFVCFNWHFMNQRRRRPVRRRDGSFNYSADNYCTKYDETTGICPDGDDCPFLHRTAGDTERRYHLRYYKTCMCVHDTDARGYCVKNGHHCAFAHGIHDQRPPVYDIKELEALQAAEASGECLNGPNVLDKERNLMNEDPKWQDTNYVLANYKTEPCKRPPRLCRQGYACPQYHNSKDKRRSPRKYKYRSTPCPNVKHGEEWGEPANCEAADNCQYCHTRTEQQFHPEIYKSTKCNDVQQAGYCPRSVFCAFAHVEPYVLTDDLTGRDLDSQALALSDMISSVLPDSGGGGGGGLGCPLSKKDKHELALLQNGSAESSESASTSSLGSNNSSHNKAPGSQLQQKHSNNLLGVATGANCNGSSSHNQTNQSSLGSLQSTMFNNGGTAASSLLSNNFPEFTPELRAQLMAIDNDLTIGPLEKEQRKRMCLTFNLRNIASSLDGSIYDITRRDTIHGLDNSISAGIASSGLLTSSSAPVNIPGSPMANSISGLLQGTSAPVNIPGSSLSNNFSPSSHSNLFGMNDAMFGGSTAHHMASSSAPKLANSFGHSGNDSLFFQPHIISPALTGNDGGLSASPELSRISELNSLNNELSNNNTSLLFDNHMQQAAAAVQHQHQQQQQQAAAAAIVAAAKGTNSNHPYSMSPLVASDMGRLRDELANKNAQMINWEEQVMQATNACEAWKAQMEESNRKTVIAEQQRDEALSHVKALKEKLEQLSISGNSTTNYRASDLRGMSLPKLKNIQAKLRAEIEEVEKVLYLETATKCMKCEENNRSVTLVPCNHYVLCDSCATTQRECPYCQTPVTSQA
ncbi:RING finger protein unkempt isoform X4 [Toxorhynchites rutilus septentrionalis]|uniref:RING finger protein unkempt isoform X4 n=1 Tax=Toxorhynchites rutilus septentrionalis TaxID=329112 RepID=UPI00247A0357|nr:RING finger protein unkempt isoform X4 [Toxorhynchites rutilus septentrionalis]